MLTWRFRAESVRDAAWAASPDFQWDASGWDGVLAQAYYRASARDLWQDAAKMSRYSIQEYSTRWFRYPYPQISAIEGPVSGMEYPMVAMEAHSDDAPDLYNVITHEIGHMWFPMTVGSDERRYAWMDEGFNTFMNTFSEEDYWKRDDRETRRNEIRQVTSLDQAPSAQPIMTPANRYKSNDNLGSLAYVKPSIMLLTLRNKVLGPEVFDTAFREYTRRWAFKHPQPADFFRTIEEVSGRDLAWFWRGFFYTTAALDQSVESVKETPDGTAFISLRSLGAAVMPVELELAFDDGSYAGGEAAGGDLVRRQPLRLPVQAREGDRARAGESGRPVPRSRARQRRLDGSRGHDALSLRRPRARGSLKPSPAEYVSVATRFAGTLDSGRPLAFSHVRTPPVRLSSLRVAIVCSIFAGRLAAQAAPASPASGPNPETVFHRLELPTPNTVRTGSGAPGPGYWQQRADYVIRATLDTTSRSVRGEERITYTNNSPDTLRYVWLQLDQNLFNSESRGFRVFGQDPRFGTKGAEVSVRLLKVGEPAVAAARGKPAAPGGAAHVRRQRHDDADRSRPSAAAQGQAAARAGVVVPVRGQQQPDGHRGHRRGHHLRGGPVVPAPGGL